MSDPVPGDDDLQETWRWLPMVVAHCEQDDYELDDPVETLREAIQHCGNAIERRRDEQEQLNWIVGQFGGDSTYQPSEEVREVVDRVESAIGAKQEGE